MNLHPIRVMIADDHELVREGFDVMIGKFKDIKLVGQASNGKELLELIPLLKPDVVFVDVKMPILDGVQTARKISENYPHVGIIALTMYDSENLITDMVESGAKSYLIKNASKNEVYEAIQAVYKGENYYCKQTHEKLTHIILKNKPNPFRKNKTVSFTPREKEIITLICQEYSSKEIASKLDISTRTVEGYRERIQEKMEVKNMAGIVVYAMRKGLFVPE